MAIITDPPAEGTLTSVAVDDRTSGGHYLPHEMNNARIDIRRIRASLIIVAKQLGLSANQTVLATINTRVDQAVTNLIGGAPDALNALNELAAALGNNANFASDVAAALGDRYTKSQTYSRSETYARTETYSRTEVEDLIAADRKLTPFKHYLGLM